MFNCAGKDDLKNNSTVLFLSRYFLKNSVLMGFPK